MADAAGAGRAARRDRLAARRRTLGLTQEDLAALLGIERSTVVRWETGVTQPLPWLRPRLAKALQVPAHQLAELLDAPTPPGPGDRGPPAAPVPRQLPPAVMNFTGRAGELAALTRMLNAAGAGSPGTVVISAIGGTAGVGKTALALQWAHQAAPRFPDGQLYVNLRGFDPTDSPVAPAVAVRGFLDALGAAPERIPRQADAQAGLYRSLLAGKRMLIVADNARDEQQVRPLLPASPACMVLVTSRNQLSGLAAADGARLLSLDVLSHAEAVQLLTARLGTARAAAEPEAMGEIAGLCALLPLALAVAAARAAASPGFPLAALAAELHDAAGRLNALDAGDPGSSVRTVFSWSYRQLSPPSARVFRLLGLHPGPDISVPAAASLAATAQPEARRLLGELTRTHLITEHVPGRYAFHDLLRAYAAAQARDHDSEAERSEAVGRALDHYLHTAHAAALLLHPARETIALTPPRPGIAPEHPADVQQALTWFEAEHQVLLAAINLAASTGFDVHAWQIAWSIAEYVNRRGQWHELAAIQDIAVAAATRMDDIAGRAVSLRVLGSACISLGDHGQAVASFAASLKLYQQLGDRRGEAKVHQFLGHAAASQGRHAEALAYSEQALRLYQAACDRAGEALMLNNVGWLHALLGDYQQARVFCRRSLTLTAELGLRDDEACVWDSLGYAEHHLGNLTEAAACYERALGNYRKFGDRFFEANTLTRLGDTHYAAGDLPRAREVWQDALVIFQDLQHPEADHLRAKLDGADETTR